jgi:hypothetical protein
VSEAIPLQPIRDRIKSCGDPNGILTAGATMISSGALSSLGAGLVTRWRGLNGCYFAPETAQLVAAIDPVKDKTDLVGQSVKAVGNALIDFGGEVAVLKPKLERLLGRASDFNAKAEAHPGWRHTSSLRGPTSVYSPFSGLHNNSDLHYEYSEIQQELRASEAQLAMAEARCVGVIRKNTDEAEVASTMPTPKANPRVNIPGYGSSIPGTGVAGPWPWELELAGGRTPFGGSWLDHAPLYAKIMTGFEKSLRDGVGALTRLVAIDYNWDLSTGKSHWDVGAHVLGPAWAGLSKVGLAGTPVLGSAAWGITSGLGHAYGNERLLSLSKSVNPYNVGKDLVKGFSGAGLPGGWGTRVGYIGGNVAQAVVPGPGKLGIAKLAKGEGLVGALGRGAKYLGDGRWLAGDARLLAGKLGGLAEGVPGLGKVSDLVHGWNVRPPAGPGHVPVPGAHERWDRAAHADQQALQRGEELTRARAGKAGFERDIAANVQRVRDAADVEAARLSAAGRHADAVAVHQRAAQEVKGIQEAAKPERERLNQAVAGAERRVEAAQAHAQRAWDEYANPPESGTKPSSLVGHATAVDSHGNKIVVQIHHHRLDPTGETAAQELQRSLSRRHGPVQAARMTDGYAKLGGVHADGAYPAAERGLVREANEIPFAVGEDTVLVKVYPGDGRVVLRTLDKYGHTVGGFIARDQDVLAATVPGLRDELALTHRVPTDLARLTSLHQVRDWLRNDHAIAPFDWVDKDGVVLVRFRPHPDDIGMLKTAVDADRLGWKHLPAHVTNVDLNPPYTGVGRAGSSRLIPEMKPPDGTGVRIIDGEVAWRHEVDGRAVETVFAVYRSGERMMLERPITYFVDDGTLVTRGVKMPGWLVDMTPASTWDMAKGAALGQVGSPVQSYGPVSGGEFYDADQQRRHEEQRRLARVIADAGLG